MFSDIFFSATLAGASLVKQSWVGLLYLTIPILRRFFSQKVVGILSVTISTLSLILSLVFLLLWKPGPGALQIIGLIFNVDPDDTKSSYLGISADAIVVFVSVLVIVLSDRVLRGISRGLSYRKLHSFANIGIMYSAFAANQTIYTMPTLIIFFLFILVWLRGEFFIYRDTSFWSLSLSITLLQLIANYVFSISDPTDMPTDYGIFDVFPKHMHIAYTHKMFYSYASLMIAYVYQVGFLVSLVDSRKKRVAEPSRELEIPWIHHSSIWIVGIASVTFFTWFRNIFYIPLILFYMVVFVKRSSSTFPIHKYFMWATVYLSLVLFSDFAIVSLHIKNEMVLKLVGETSNAFRQSFYWGFAVLFLNAHFTRYASIRHLQIGMVMDDGEQHPNYFGEILALLRERAQVAKKWSIYFSLTALLLVTVANITPVNVVFLVMYFIFNANSRLGKKLWKYLTLYAVSVFIFFYADLILGFYDSSMLEETNAHYLMLFAVTIIATIQQRIFSLPVRSEGSLTPIVFGHPLARILVPGLGDLSIFIIIIYFVAPGSTYIGVIFLGIALLNILFNYAFNSSERTSYRLYLFMTVAFSSYIVILYLANFEFFKNFLDDIGKFIGIDDIRNGLDKLDSLSSTAPIIATYSLMVLVKNFMRFHLNNDTGHFKRRPTKKGQLGAKLLDEEESSTSSSESLTRMDYTFILGGKVFYFVARAFVFWYYYATLLLLFYLSMYVFDAFYIFVGILTAFACLKPGYMAFSRFFILILLTVGFFVVYILRLDVFSGFLESNWGKYLHFQKDMSISPYWIGLYFTLLYKLRRKLKKRLREMENENRERGSGVQREKILKWLRGHVVGFLTNINTHLGVEILVYILLVLALYKASFYSILYIFTAFILSINRRNPSMVSKSIYITRLMLFLVVLFQIFIAVGRPPDGSKSWNVDSNTWFNTSSMPDAWVSYLSLDKPTQMQIFGEFLLLLYAVVVGMNTKPANERRIVEYSPLSGRDRIVVFAHSTFRNALVAMVLLSIFGLRNFVNFVYLLIIAYRGITTRTIFDVSTWKAVRVVASFHALLIFAFYIPVFGPDGSIDYPSAFRFLGLEKGKDDITRYEDLAVLYALLTLLLRYFGSSEYVGYLSYKREEYNQRLDKIRNIEKRARCIEAHENAVRQRGLDKRMERFKVIKKNIGGIVSDKDGAILQREEMERQKKIYERIDAVLGDTLNRVTGQVMNEEDTETGSLSSKEEAPGSGEDKETGSLGSKEEAPDSGKEDRSDTDDESGDADSARNPDVLLEEVTLTETTGVNRESEDDDSEKKETTDTSSSESENSQGVDEASEEPGKISKVLSTASDKIHRFGAWILRTLILNIDLVKNYDISMIDEEYFQTIRAAGYKKAQEEEFSKVLGKIRGDSDQEDEDGALRVLHILTEFIKSNILGITWIVILFYPLVNPSAITALYVLSVIFVGWIRTSGMTRFWRTLLVATYILILTKFVFSLGYIGLSYNDALGGYFYTLGGRSIFYDTQVDYSYYVGFSVLPCTTELMYLVLMVLLFEDNYHTERVLLRLPTEKSATVSDKTASGSNGSRESDGYPGMGKLDALRTKVLEIVGVDTTKLCGSDYYFYIFTFEFATFLYLAVYYKDFTRFSTDSLMDYLSSNTSIPRFFVTILFLQFLLILFDRYIYIKKDLEMKLYLHLVNASVNLFNIFITVPFSVAVKFNSYTPLIVYYGLKLGGFFFSALQLRHGFPYSESELTIIDGYGVMNEYVHKIVPMIPFAYEISILLRWYATPTSLTFTEYLKLNDIQNTLYTRQLERVKKLRKIADKLRAENKGVEMDKEEFEEMVLKRYRAKPIGRRIKKSTKHLVGGGLLGVLVLLLFLPLFMNSSNQADIRSNYVKHLSASVSLESWNEFYFFNNIISNKSGNIDPDALPSTVCPSAKSKIENLQEVSLYPYSEEYWSITSESLERLMHDLVGYNHSIRLIFKIEVETKFPMGIEKTNVKQQTFVKKISLEDREKMRNIINNKNGSLLISDFLYTTYDIPFTGDISEMCDNQMDIVMTLESGSEDTDLTMYWKITDKAGRPLKIFLVNNNVAVDNVSNLALGMGGAVGLYLGVVLSVSRFLRMYVRGLSEKIMFEDLPDPSTLFSLVKDVVWAQKNSYLALENVLYKQIVEIYRDPQKIIKLTGQTLQEDFQYVIEE